MLAFAAVVVGVVSCEPNGLIVPYSCDHPCVTCSDPCGECKGGACVPPVPVAFTGPALLAFGRESELPDCPVNAPHLTFEGFAPVELAPECPVCACGEPTCLLPEALWGNTTACPGASEVPFDVPAGWDGSCVAPGTMPASPLLSVTLGDFGPSGCEPFEEPPVPRDAPKTEAIAARACQGVTVDPNPCTDMGELCAAAAGAHEGTFLQCVVAFGDTVACPASYPEPHVFYEDFMDMRSCTPCACEAPTGSDCVVSVSMYEDDACMSFPEYQDVMQQDADPCVESIGALAEIRSVKAQIAPGSQTGSCQPSGGEPTGVIVDKKNPVTFCCRPPF